MGHLGSFFSDRLGWESHLKPFLEKPLPADLNCTFTLGSLGALLLVVQALSLIHISEPTRPVGISRMPSSA